MMKVTFECDVGLWLFVRLNNGLFAATNKTIVQSDKQSHHHATYKPCPCVIYTNIHEVKVLSILGRLHLSVASGRDCLLDFTVIFFAATKKTIVQSDKQSLCFTTRHTNLSCIRKLDTIVSTSPPTTTLPIVRTVRYMKLNFVMVIRFVADCVQWLRINIKRHTQVQAVATQATTPSYVTHIGHIGTTTDSDISPFTNVGVHAFNNIIQVRRSVRVCKTWW